MFKCFPAAWWEMLINKRLRGHGLNVYVQGRGWFTRRIKEIMFTGKGLREL